MKILAKNALGAFAETMSLYVDGSHVKSASVPFETLGDHSPETLGEVLVEFGFYAEDIDISEDVDAFNLRSTVNGTDMHWEID